MAPYNSQLSYDNSGLNIGSFDEVVTGITVALDCTADVFDEAVSHGDNLIITHHPIIFHPIKSIAPVDISYRAISLGLNCLSCHTNLDMADGGVNDCLCRQLGIVNVEKMMCADGTEIRRGEFETEFPDCETACKYISEKSGFPVKFIRLKNKKKIRSVAVCSGSGGDLIDDVFLNGIDAFITGEARHSEFLRAETLGVPIFVMGHYESEEIIVDELYNKIKENFDVNIHKFEKTSIETILK